MPVDSARTIGQFRNGAARVGQRTKSQRKGARRKDRSAAGNMDVFKLAFETIVVGLLAYVWLGVATYLVSPTSWPTFFFGASPFLPRTIKPS